MTAAFEKFLKEHRSTGSEKADGYSPDIFPAIEPHEREIVFDMLVDKLPWSAQWLVLVDLDKALSVLRQKEAELRGDPDEDVYMLQQQLVISSGELVYQEHMIEDYPSYIERSKSWVVDAVSRTPKNQAVLDFFRQVILVETNDDAVASACWHLLSAVDFPQDSPTERANAKRLVTDLRSDNEHAKLRALDEIDQFKNGV